jgi:MerR family transcriptional regulator, copper efflux regulator
MERINIGKLSKIVDLPTKTIRYYEDAGLISKAHRSENGYRQYAKSTIEELKVIKYARKLGLHIEEIKKLLHQTPYLDKYIDNHLHEISQKITDLKKVKANLQSLKKDLQNPQIDCTGDEWCCNIFYQVIKQKTKGGEINDL